MNSDKWLLCTNHLLGYSGSEIVILELAEELLSRGYEVFVHANFQNIEFIKKFAHNDIIFLNKKEDINLKVFSFVYIQHQLLSYFISDQDLEFLSSSERPIFIFNHLSPYELFEAPSPFIEPYFADIILANSPETQKELKKYGSRFSQVSLFQNPAPKRFCAPARQLKERPTRILSVSNHLPSELVEAFEQTSRGWNRSHTNWACKWTKDAPARGFYRK